MQTSDIEQAIIQDSIKLKPQSRYFIAEKLLESLDLPDKKLNDLWVDESISRLNEYKKGNLETLEYSQVFK